MKRLIAFAAAIIIATGIVWLSITHKSNASTNPVSAESNLVLASTPTPTPSSMHNGMNIKSTSPILADGTHTGSSFQAEDYGQVQVAIVVSGGKITDVKVLRQPSAHERSVQINNYAIPQLKSEAVSAQSANIDIISGATASSDAFISSLTSALAS